MGAVLFTSAPARADGDPDLAWWTITTPHFRVHYARSYEPVAERVARLAEGIHERLKDSLGHSPAAGTEIVLTDDTDSANGSATALPYNTIRLYVTAPDDNSPLSDIDDWYLELITHEYTHILHTDNISGVPAIINAIIGKTYSPNQAQPRWILEGLAVVKESQHSSGGRLRSGTWDMYLRADVLGDNIATLDQVTSGGYRWPQGNLWYLYGSRFLGWISDVYGPNTMRAVSADYGATLLPWGLNRAIRRQTGRTYEELYEGFKDYIRRQYKEQIRKVEAQGLREGTRITHHGREVDYPRFLPKSARSGDAEELDYFRADQNERSGVYRLRLDAPEDETLIARVNGVSTTSYTPAGETVFDSGSVYRNIYLRNDLFALPKGETAPDGDNSTRRRLTTGMRASFPDVSPNGKKIVFTVNNKGTTYLEIADVTAEGVVMNRRDLVPSARFEQAFSPRFSPDGKRVAYSAWTHGGFRDVRIVDVATGSFEYVTHDRAMDVNPVWSPDGSTLYFSSDRTGIFNIHAYDVATKKLEQVTNVKIGALMPAVSSSGKTLVYVGYTTEGFDLYQMPLDPSRYLPAAPPPQDRPDPPMDPLPIPLAKKPYSPLPTIYPHKFLFDYKPSQYGDNALTVKASASDVVGLHTLGLAVTADPKAPSPIVTVDYSYDRLPFDVGGRFFHTVQPRAGYRVNNENLGYDEYTTGLTTGVSYTARSDFSSQSIGMSISAVHFKGDLPVGRFTDPYDKVTRDPPEGNLNILHLGYSFSNVEYALDAPGGPVRGTSVDLSLDYGSAYLGSQYSVRALEAIYTHYIEMPWRKHVLALRTGIGISGGEYPRGSNYSVGGYDLPNNTLTSTILSGALNGAFVLRGYPPNTYYGTEYFLQNLEYRFPLAIIDHGYSTLPVYLRRIDGNFFIDYGGAFNKFDWKHLSLFRNGNFIDTDQLHTSMGAEVWFNLVLGYGLATQLRLGLAHGYSQDAEKPFQLYFVASGAF